MITMSQKETLDWLKKHDINEKNILENYELKLSEHIPIDSGRKNYLSKEIAAFFDKNEILLYINEFGIWPSSENMYLFDGYRKSIGIENKIYEKPSHIINKNENIEFYCILDMILYFFMGCMIIPIENQNEIITISHDEFIDIYEKKGEHKSIIINGLKNIIKSD
jgi:hypothetical protein